MYIPSLFKNENLEEVRAFLKENSFGILLSTNNQKMIGTHIPLELEEDINGEEVFYGHISKGNAQWKSFEDGQEVLLIFNGPHAYVSSSWYGHENVPTWNYIAVHVYGTIKLLEEEELLYALTKLVDKYEARQKNPVSVKEFSETTMKQTRGVVGFKVALSEIQAAYKLSQNRNDEDYHNIVNHLNKSDISTDQSLGDVMNGKRKLG